MLNRLVAPEVSFDSEINKIEYDSHILTNNIPIYSISDSTQSVVGIQIIFGGGKISEEVPGVSYFSTNLLKSGTRIHDSNYINNFFEFRGSFVQYQNGLDYNSLSLYCLSEKLTEILPLFLELYIDPDFPIDHLEKLKKKKAQEVSVNKKKSSFWANKLLKESLFGNHPYGHLISLDDIEAIDKNIIERHWNRFASSNILFFTVAGDFNIDYITSSFNKLPPNKNQDINNPIHNHSTKNELIKKSLENSEQTSLKIGQPIISLSHENYPKFTLGNTIWGGYFGSRLMQTIREEKGLTYGIRSSLIHLKEASYLQISADLKKGAGKETVELINEELDNLVSGTLTEEEVEKVKRYIIGEYKSSIESIFDKIAKVKFLKLNKLSDTFFVHLYNQILESTPGQVQAILKETIRPESFHSVLVE